MVQNGFTSKQTPKLFGKIAPIVNDVLYFASFEQPPASNPEFRYILIDERVHYEPFYSDFGPLNLSVLYRFCKFIHSLLETKPKRKILCWTNASEENRDENRVNGAYLLAAYLVIYCKVSADQAYLRIRMAEDEESEFIGFRDAAMGEPTYLLHIHDVLRGIEKAIEHGWLNFDDFDPDEYEYYERVENGDLNWIIPTGKKQILSFCGPHAKSVIENGYPYHAPEVYFNYFRTHDVTTIVRLNMKMYEASKFTEAGFQHVDLFFIDGSTPSDEIIEKFIKVVDDSPGAVAIHCKAGLGRTGTLIACWMMKEFGLNAAECMAWLRICRPGSVIGPQQQFLVRKQKFCWKMSNNNLIMQIGLTGKKQGDATEGKLNNLTTKVDEIRLENQQNGNIVITSPRRSRNSSKCIVGEIVDETATDEHGRTQGDRLLEMKVRSQHAAHKNEATEKAASSREKPRVANSSTGYSSMSNTKLPSTYSLHSPHIRRSGKSSSALLSGQAALNQALLKVQMNSPRFSSPTTPIKSMFNNSPIVPPRSTYVARNLLTSNKSQTNIQRTPTVPAAFRD
ncbi:unnamed protein product, partial [Mesorhabditis belari]|uniref:protein-tyrosine-phosphatase n=1 Tax=Mesorhabditis belari TaxID=2138241 RepID=A0AAF3F0A2_9BILA